MRRYRTQTGGRGSPGLPWELVPNGTAIWRACRRHIRARRYPPAGWSWPDWREEIEAVCFARALEALRQFDPARLVPVAAYLHVQVHYALSERYRQESRFAARCRACSEAIREPANPEESIAPERGAAAWLAMQALPDNDRRLLERLVLEGDREVHLAHDLGVSQATISRHKQKLLQLLRARLDSAPKNDD
jgi:RNA polymerase sigma factor (sigma-70 family)